MEHFVSHLCATVLSAIPERTFNSRALLVSAHTSWRALLSPFQHNMDPAIVQQFKQSAVDYGPDTVVPSFVEPIGKARGREPPPSMEPVSVRSAALDCVHL